MKHLVTMAIACAAFAGNTPALAQSREAPPSARQACWSRPAPQNLAEVAAVLANSQALGAQRSGARAAPKTGLLALSSGKIAYGAGLLVGWGETGKRPVFTIVTAVGTSALFAPFAFLGADGDQKIADIFTCSARSLEEMALRAASYLDEATLTKIAARHEQGARLIVALPGSAARAETVWDLGAIAASRHPRALEHIKDILLASVDLTTFVDPATLSIPAGSIVERDRFTFRQVGAGERLLSFEPASVASAVYVIHNGVLFPDESAKFMARYTAPLGREAAEGRASLVPAYDFFLVAKSARSGIRIASLRPSLALQPQSEFDMAYNSALFLYAYRRGRMKQEWRSSFPDWEAYQR
jgi:hypothetical protein